MRSFEPPEYKDVLQAVRRIEGEAIKTPLLKSPLLNEITGADVFIKPENLQVTGSFKFRGAYNAISALEPNDRQNGVVATSSGNHAQGIAEAARRHGISATIIMPSDAPMTKIERTKRFGGKVILYDRLNEDRDEVAARVMAKTNASYVHPFNNPFVIAGQGTSGFEVCEDLKSMHKSLDRIFVCTGGGGLTAGITLCVQEAFPKASIHSCEPVGFDDYRRSLEAGSITSNETLGGSVCDAILTPAPGELGFAINKSKLSEGRVISDEEALRAVAYAYRELKLVVEPGGAAALAALLQSDQKHAGETIAIILSGGNVDQHVLNMALDLPNLN